MPLTRKPRPGDRIGFGDLTTSGWTPPVKATDTVHHLDGNLCRTVRDGARPGADLNVFIWIFGTRAEGYDVSELNQCAHIFEEEPTDE